MIQANVTLGNNLALIGAWYARTYQPYLCVLIIFERIEPKRLKFWFELLDSKTD